MKTIFPGEEGILVQYLQLALTRAGYVTGIDGIFGPSTCRILNAFLGAETDCTVTEKVWEQLIPYLKGYTSHLIRRGDTIYSIAERYRTRGELIMQANPELLPERLVPGTRINVPFDFDVVATNVPYTSLLSTYAVEGLAARYPFLNIQNAGNSVMGRWIPVIRIGTGEKQVFYSASFHANESITTPVLLKYAEEYAGAYASGRELGGVSASKLYEENELWLMPLVNPDGVDLVNGLITEGSYYDSALRIAADYPQIPFPDGWKANINGVDLNLQFPAGWENAREIKYSQGYTTPAPRDYVGEAPLSEPESRAVAEVTLAQDFMLILAYHTQGEVIYWKYLDYDPAGSREIADYFAAVSGYAVEETPAVSGYAGYKDWFIKTYNRPGYTIEAGLGENPLPMSQFEKIYRDNAGILTGGMTQSRSV